MAYARYVERVPGRKGGEPVFVGTRIPLRTIARMIALGASASELMEDFRLSEPMIELAGLCAGALEADRTKEE